MIRAFLGIAVTACVAVAACSSSPNEPAAKSDTKVANKDEVSQRISEYFGKSVSPGIALRVRDLAPGEVAGWNKGTLEVVAGGNTQTMPFLVSQDGRYFISG